MRVLQINKFFFRKGGSEQYYFALSRALEKRGHTVLQFSMQHPRNVASPYAKYFVGHIDYQKIDSARQRIGQGLSMIRSREADEKIQNLIDHERPRVAHLHNVYHQITPSIIRVLSRAGVPIVLTLHDYKLVCPSYTLFDGHGYCYRCKGGRFFNAPRVRCRDGSRVRSAWLAIEAYWQRLSKVYDKVGAFLAPSQYMRDVMVEAGFGAERVRYLRSFVGNEDVSEDETFDSGELAAKLPERYVLYFGRLSAEKGLVTLLDAIARLRDVPLVICGEGPLEGSLRDDVRRRQLQQVVFVGFVDKPGLNSVIRRSRAVIVPSEWPENAPFTVLEAMALSVPVIVSDMGGLPELAAAAEGDVFPAGDAAALARSIDSLWSDEARAERIGKNGGRMIRERFSEDVHLHEIEALYASIQ